jgi:PHO85 cyclin-1
LFFQCRYAYLFSQAEVNLMEKQLLYLLDYDLAVTESELHHHLSPFLAQFLTPQLPTLPLPARHAPAYPTPVTTRHSSRSSSTSSSLAHSATPSPLLKYVGAGHHHRRQGIHHLPPPPPSLDRSDSTSSLDSNSSYGSSMPATPEAPLHLVHLAARAAHKPSLDDVASAAQVTTITPSSRREKPAGSSPSGQAAGGNFFNRLVRSAGAKREKPQRVAATKVTGQQLSAADLVVIL